MSRKELIALFVVAAVGGISITDSLLSSNHQTADQEIVPSSASVSEVLTRPSDYTGIVADVDNAAEQITVGIAASRSGSSRSSLLGSGVILARQGSTYYVATAGHILDKDEQYEIITPDGETYSLNNQDIVRSNAYDLTIFSFESNQNYTVATINHRAIGRNFAGEARNQAVFVSGFTSEAGETASRRIITGGKVMLRGGFHAAGLLYRNISHAGMEGGAVLDQSGKLIGINLGTYEQLHIEDDGYENLAIGFGRGVPIHDDVLGFWATHPRLDVEWLNIEEEPAPDISTESWDSVTNQLLTVDRPDDDTDSVAWMNYGNQLWRYGKYDEAIAALERVVDIDPELDQAYYTIGLIHWEQDNAQQAVEDLQAAIRINPDVASYWYLLSASYGRLGDDAGISTYRDKEISALEQAIDRNPQDFVLRMELGLLLQRLQRYEDAVTLFSEAIRINPDHPIAYNDRAITYTISQQYEKALSDYTKAISINSLFARAYNNRGSTYDYMREYENALADFDQAISINPNYASPYSNRGNTYYALGDYEQALANYDQALTIDPELSDAYRAREAVYATLQQRYGQPEFDILQRSAELNQ